MKDQMGYLVFIVVAFSLTDLTCFSFWQVTTRVMSQLQLHGPGLRLMIFSLSVAKGSRRIAVDCPTAWLPDCPTDWRKGEVETEEEGEKMLIFFFTLSNATIINLVGVTAWKSIQLLKNWNWIYEYDWDTPGNGLKYVHQSTQIVGTNLFWHG